MILRPRQKLFVEKCHQALDQYGAALGVAPTGAGKTVMLSAAASRYKRALILQHRDELVSQNRKTYTAVNPKKRSDLFTADRKTWGQHATFGMVQTLVKERNLATMPQDLDLLVVDECFPAGTLVDGKPIESIQLGDEVKSHLGIGKVAHLFKKKPSSLVSVILSDGKMLTCTEEHPIFTQDGFKAAKNLNGSDMMVSIISYEQLRNLSERNSAETIQELEAGETLRKQGVQGRTFQADHSEHICKARGANHEVQDKQRDAQSRGSSVGVNETQGNGLETNSERWERNWADSTSACAGSGIGMGHGSCNPDETTAIRRSLSDLLQGGYWKQYLEGCNRSGRQLTQCVEAQSSGCEERRVFAFHRVDRVKIHEQTSCGTFGGLCPDGFVYNLEVENGNTYFANGFLVHNCHHVAAASYLRIIEEFRERNPEGHILGLTATPQRSDRKALISVFPTVADIIQLGELVQGGFLVKPRGIVMDLGLKAELDRIPKMSDFDMDEVAEVLDKSPLNDRIVREWKQHAGKRQTVVFTATVAHAEHMCESFVEAGVAAVVVHGEMSGGDRVATLKAFDEGRYQVVLNVAVLTEGWDCQPVSCVVLVRPCSSKSVMLQMVGRGLRKLDPERYPGQTKSDCLIMDFGYSLVTHGNLEAEVRLVTKAKDSEPGEAPSKKCKGCGISLPISTMICPICGYEDKVSKGVLEEFRMTEVELIDASPFQWESMFDGLVLVANGMQAWAAVISFGGCFWAVGAVEGQRLQKLDVSDDKILAISSADDFLRSNGDTSLCRKTRSWLNLPPTQKQIEMLQNGANMFNMSRYRASCLLTWKFNEGKIRTKLTK
jgi:superfamily II DNA or RNA helicase